MVLRHVQDAVSSPGIHQVIRGDRLVQSRLELTSCWVAYILAVVGDVDDAVAFHLRRASSAAPNLPVVRLTLKLAARTVR